jgi:LPXTG-motif cell wall-anchored protein
MKAQRNCTKLTKVALVLSVALLFVAATAAPAIADDDEQLLVDLVVVEALIGLEDLPEAQPVEEPVIGDGGSWEMVPVEEEPQTFPDAGGWEMVPVQEEQTFPDAGADEAVEITETPVPQGGDDEGQETTETPQAEEETATPPAETDDDPALPFTGGNSTPFALAGIALMVAGAGYLVRKRYVFARK